MAEEFQLGSTGNWWESSTTTATTRNRYDDHQSMVGSATASTSSLNNSNSFGWPTQIVDININKARSSMDSVSVSGSSMAFPSDPHHNSQKLQLLQPHESCPPLPDPSLQMMDLTLSSQTMDWNQAQALFRSEKGAGESSFRSMLQEEASSGNFQQHQDQRWRHKIYSASSSDQDSSNNISRGGLSLDQSQFSPNMSTGSNHPNFQLDSSATYANTSPPNVVLQGLLVSDTHHHQQQQQHPSMNYSYPTPISSTTYGGINTTVPDHHQLMAAPAASWSNNKFPQFLRTSPPPKPPPPPPQHHQHGQLHFSNNTPFWNASSASMNDVRSSLFPSPQSQISLPNFEEKTNKSKQNTSEARDSSIAKKSTSSNETSSKRPRNETPVPMPAFKVRKEKMGDRITALQQLVSPFGKTDTASVLSEAIEYIKFLHEQVSALSSPYMKSGAPMIHQQNPDKSKDPGEGPNKQDLRSRGLCLVPVSSTFPVTHETTMDFWAPTFGGNFR